MFTGYDLRKNFNKALIFYKDGKYILLHIIITNYKSQIRVEFFNPDIYRTRTAHTDIDILVFLTFPVGLSSLIFTRR